jgi:hypothetical protein
VAIIERCCDVLEEVELVREWFVFVVVVCCAG